MKAIYEPPRYVSGGVDIDFATFGFGNSLKLQWYLSIPNLQWTNLWRPLGVTFQHIIDMLLKRLEKSLLQYTSESVTRNFSFRLLYILTQTNHLRVPYRISDFIYLSTFRKKKRYRLSKNTVGRQNPAPVGMMKTLFRPPSFLCTAAARILFQGIIDETRWSRSTWPSAPVSLTSKIPPMGSPKFKT